MRIKLKRTVGAAILATLFLGPPAIAQEPIATMQVAGGFDAEVVESIRADGMLTVTVRFVSESSRNTRTIYQDISDVFEDGIYITAAGNRYLLLADSTGVPLAPSSLTLSARTGANWFGQFPAPDEEVTHYSLTLPSGIFFPRVPINDE